MATTRRELIEGMVIAGVAAALPAGALGSKARAWAFAGPVACPNEPMLGALGSPHYLTSCAPDELGGSAYERLREHTLHFAMSAEHRDRYLLGI